MGYGKKLKSYLDEKGMTVKDISRLTNISPTTLYSIIQRDSDIRFDMALRISNILQIDVNEICKDNPYRDTDDDTEALPELLPEWGGKLTKNNIKAYMKYRSLPILMLLGYDEMPNVDRLLAGYYKLTDEGRAQFFDLLDALSKRLEDPERSKKLKEII